MHWHKYIKDLVADQNYITDNPDKVTCKLCLGTMERENTQRERERTLARLIWETSRADEGTISATGADIIAEAILNAGYHL